MTEHLAAPVTIRTSQTRFSAAAVQFQVRYLDSGAMAIREERIEADSEQVLRARLRDDGKQLLSAEALSRPWLERTWLRHRTPALSTRSLAEVSLFCRELRALTGAGLSVVEALEALSAQGVDTASSVYEQLLSRLRMGRSLSSAMADVGGFPGLLVASVQSSERTSNLADALESFLRYDEIVGALRRRIISSALYPAIVVILGVLIAVFLLWVVIPRFASLYGQMGQGAGTATAMLLGLSQTLHRAPWLVPACLVALALLIALAVAGGQWRRVIRGVLNLVPSSIQPLRQFELARTFEALALLVKGGFSFHEALELSKQLADSPASRERIAAAQRAVEQGTSVSRACAQAGLTDPITERLLRASERGGDFAAVLRAIGQRHASAFETFVERATRVIEPVLLLGVALLVGSMVVLLYMPIFDIASSIR